MLVSPHPPIHPSFHRKSHTHTHTHTHTDTPNREETYNKRATNFQHHAKQMADTAAALAKSGGVTDRKLANDLISTSAKVREIEKKKIPANMHLHLFYMTLYMSSLDVFSFGM